MGSWLYQTLTILSMRRGWPARLVIMMICKSQRFAILIILLCILSAIAILLIFAKLYCSAEQDHISTPEGKADHQVMSTSTAPMRLNIDSNEITVLDKFSVIIPTYRRVILLKRVLSNLCDLESLVDCIIVVWNNIAEPIPDDLLQFNCKVRLYFKKEATNSLNNRFIHYSEIRTEAILSNDDDLLIPKQDLDLQFQTWKVAKHLIVGFMHRKHTEHPKNSGNYVYSFNPQDDNYSIILTTSAMFHVQYLDLYQSMLTDEFRGYIDKTMNCEDILMNVVVGKYLNDTIGHTSCPCLFIPGESHLERLESKNDNSYKGLWLRNDHFFVRSKCLNMIAKEFNGLPLGYSSLMVKYYNSDELHVSS